MGSNITDYMQHTHTEACTPPCIHLTHAHTHTTHMHTRTHTCTFTQNYSTAWARQDKSIIMTIQLNNLKQYKAQSAHAESTHIRNNKYLTHLQ